MRRIVFLLAIAIGVAACDKVDKPYKIYKPDIVDTPVFLPLGDVVQKYLFEDYTGHLCNNCPEGAEVIKAMKAAMGDTLISIAVHAGVESMIKPNPVEKGCSNGYTADYRTQVGSEYATEFKIRGNPSGMINRMAFNGNRVSESVANWATLMNSVPRNQPTMGMQIIPIHHKDTAYIFIKTTLLSEVSCKLRLCAVLTESGIISPQKNKKESVGSVPDICDYEHNHLLRTSISPIWGESIDLSQKGDTVIKAYALPLAGTSWKIEHCRIIAYIYDDDTKEILQVEEVEL